MVTSKATPGNRPLVLVLIVMFLIGVAWSTRWVSVSDFVVLSAPSKASASVGKKVAYALVFTHAGVGSLFGAAQVASRMRKVRSRADLVVAVDQTTAPADWSVLKQMYYEMGVTHVVDADLSPILNATAGKGLWQGVFGKLFAYTFVQYSRVIVLDADWVMVMNCDDAFEMAAPAMVQWEEPTSLNSGFFLFSPSLDAYADMLRALSRIPSNETVRRDRERLSASAPLGSAVQKAEFFLTDATDQGFFFAYLSSDEAIGKGYGPIHVLPNMYNLHDVFFWFSLKGFSQPTLDFGWLFMLGPNRHHIRGVHLIDKPYHHMNNLTEFERHKAETSKLLEGYNCLWWRAAWDSLQRIKIPSSQYSDESAIVQLKSDTCREEAIRLVEVP